MKVELVGFSQGVSLENKDEHQSFLDFRREDGRLFRLPVTEEALELLMAEVYGSEESAPAEPPQEDGEERLEEPNGASGNESFGTSFGGDIEAGVPPEAPASEEEVPSL